MKRYSDPAGDFGAEKKIIMEREEDRLLNLSEAAQFLGINEEALKKLAEAGVISAYKIGGVFLRFKVEQLIEIKPVINEKIGNLSKHPKGKKVKLNRERYTFFERLIDFWHFYDFYIISMLIIAFILYVIFKWGI